jgi:two-component system OmpR family sensor kinase
MPLPFRSIRVRLTFWYSLLVFSTLVAFGAVSYYYTNKSLSENLDASLKYEVRWVRDYIEPQVSKVRRGRRSFNTIIRDRAKEPLPGGDTIDRDSVVEESDEVWNQILRHSLQGRKKTYIQIIDDHGQIAHRSYNLATDSIVVRDTIPMYVTYLTMGELSGDPVRVAAIREKTFTYFVGYPVAELRDYLDNLYLIFLILIPTALAVSIFGGFALATRALKPVDNITTRARRITAENLDQTIPGTNVDDEIGRLTVTINEMIHRLHESFAQIRQFSADASHELRTPLTIIRGEIELSLRSPKTPEEYRGVLESTLEEILRLNSIIDNLLMLAKADQQSYHANFSEVDLKSLTEELFEDSEVLAQSKHIAVRLRMNAVTTIVADRIRLRQLFLNLIDNAIKYTPEGGAVTISIDRQDGHVVFEVEDTGIGIPEGEQEKIFDRFYRVDKARSRELGGTGLGLSIARWIAELHRGTITVRSELNRGSVFRVIIPTN